MKTIPIRNLAFLAVTLSAVLFALHPRFAEAQAFRDGAVFWQPPGNTSQCRASFEGIGSFTLSQTLTRAAYPNDDAVNFAAHYGMLLAQTIAGRNVAQNKSFILDAAARGAYTKANMKNGWSPIYVQSNLIRLTAMFIVALEHRGQLDAAERAQLVAWGNKMIPGQKGSKQNKSADSLMASGVAMIAWGNVTGDTGLMKSGYKKFLKGLPYVMKSVGKLARHSGHRGIPVSALSLEDEYNVALQHAVEGAAILRNLGVDVASVKTGGRTLHDAVAWWAGVAASHPAQFKGGRAWSHNYHLGWIPVYLHFFSGQPSAAQLKALARQVTGGRSPSFRAISLGGATDCLW